MTKNTCRDCNRTVMLVAVGGESLAVDPELIAVVPARRTSHDGGGQPHIRMASSQTFARRIHAEQCQGYQEAAKKKRVQDEMRAFTKQQERAGRSARRNRGL